MCTSDSFQYNFLQEYQRGWGGGEVGSLSFDIQGYGCRPISTHSDRQIKGEGGGVPKLDIVHGCHKCIDPN